MMIRAFQYMGQVAAYGGFIIFIGYLSAAPVYVRLQPDQAQIKLSFSHAGKPVSECRERSDEELARLAPNMRIRKVCPRERSSVAVVLEMDNKLLYSDILQPSGLKKDGTSTTYKKFTVKAGKYKIKIKLKDDFQKSATINDVSKLGVDDFNYTSFKQVNLGPGKIMVIDFNKEADGFVFSF